jgi:tetratricopeptide (TPR) repeat protein
MVSHNEGVLNTYRLINRANGAARVILLCLTLALALSFSINKVEERDFGWLLKTGQYICESAAVPRADVYSYTAAGNKYIDSHWLYQVLLYASYRLLGIAGPTLLTAALALVTFVLVYRAGFDREKYAVTATLTAAAIIMASERFLTRPHVVTLFFLAAYFLILERHRERGTRLIFLLPVLQLLWVNMHGLFVLGLILPAVYLAFALLERILKLPRGLNLCGHELIRTALPACVRIARANKLATTEGWETNRQIDGRAIGALLFVFLVMLGESLLNPYTLDLALYPLTLFKEIHSGANVVATSVGELAAPLASGDLSLSERVFIWMIGISALGFLLNLRRLNLTRLFLFAAFLYLALTARRNIDLFSVIAAPIAVMNFNQFLDEMFARFERLNLRDAFAVTQLAVSPLIMASMLYLIFQVVTNRYYLSDRDLTRFGFGIARHAYPVKAASFVDAANPGGQMFNEPSDGGYLIWRFYPQRKVFFDGRWEVYGDAFFENFKMLCSDPTRFEKYAAAKDIRYVILPHSIPHNERLIKYMIGSPLWAAVYFDEVSVVFVRNIPENADVIAKFKIHFATFEMTKGQFDARLPSGIDDPHFAGMDSPLVRLSDRLTPKQDHVFDEIARANFHTGLGDYESAKLLYRQAIQICPDSDIAHAQLGAVYFNQKQYMPALIEFEAAQELNPRSVANTMNLANTNLILGDFENAEDYYKKARKLDCRNAVASLQLGKLYARKGQTKDAVRELKRALKLDPNSREARDLLLQIQNR